MAWNGAVAHAPAYVSRNGTSGSEPPAGPAPTYEAIIRAQVIVSGMTISAPSESAMP